MLLVEAQYFSTLDLTSGYHQISMYPRDQHKRAFMTPFCLYEYTRMPIGLVSAPATFQRLMQATMQNFPFQFLLVYLDDFLVYSKMFDLEWFLQRVIVTDLKLKASKCAKSPIWSHLSGAKSPILATRSWLMEWAVNLARWSVCRTG